MELQLIIETLIWLYNKLINYIAEKETAQAVSLTMDNQVKNQVMSFCGMTLVILHMLLYK